MSPFEYLGNEHRQLSQVLGVLEQLASAAAAGQRVDREELGTIVDFFREFGDVGHHDKEENLLMPALVRQHMDWNDGPLAEMRRDHQQERYLMRSLRHAAQQLEAWSLEDTRHFVAIAQSFAAFQRQHMSKENEIWFVEAEKRLSLAEQQLLVEGFRRLDAELSALKDYTSICRRALELVAKYSEASR